MKNKLTLLFSVALFITISVAKAQTPAPPPADFQGGKDVDYSKYNDMVKQYITWYDKAPLDKDTALRRQVMGFLIIWIAGSPAVTVKLGEVVTPILKDKKNIYAVDLLIAYMGGTALYQLNNPNDKDEANIELAGVEAVLELAKNNSGLLADSKAIKKFNGMSPDELKSYVNNCVKKDSK